MKATNLFCLGLACFIFLTINGKAQEIPPIDSAAIEADMKLSQWLFTYDHVAWWTSDSVKENDNSVFERLGREWFCYNDENPNIWHAIYGKYTEGIYDLVLHYVLNIDSGYIIRRCYDNPDTSFLNGYARALVTANNMFEDFADTINIIYNQFIRKNDDGTYTVWFLPAYQPDNLAVYGREYIFDINSSGNEIVNDRSFFNVGIFGFAVSYPREITLGYPEADRPTLGAMYFMSTFGQYFNKILVETKYYISSLELDENDNIVWQHFPKEKSEDQ